MATEHASSAVVVPPEPARPRTLLVGSAFAAVASCMVFAGLFGWYLHLRDEAVATGGEWIGEGKIQLSPGSMMLVTSVMTLVTVAWALHAVLSDDRPHAYLALGLTLLLGIANINQQVFYLREMALSTSDSVAEMMVNTIVGSHMVMLVGAMIFLLVTAFRALGGQYSSRQADGVQAALIYWYATVFIYWAVWYGITITK